MGELVGRRCRAAALFQSLLYEACGRTINPVYGSAGLLWSGQWHLCEAAVDSVLRGNALQICSPVQAPTSATPLSLSQPVAQGGGADPQQRVGQLRSSSGSAVPSTFPFHMMDPASMAYWPLAMSPMVGAHMAAMGSAASAAAAYQASYQNAGSCQAQAYMPSSAHGSLQYSPLNVSNVPQTYQQSWSPEMLPPGMSAENRSEETYEQPPSQSSSAMVGSASGTETCSGSHCPSPPLVTPVPRRLTPQSGPFMPPVNSGAEHSTHVVDSTGKACSGCFV